VGVTLIVALALAALPSPTLPARRGQAQRFAAELFALEPDTKLEMQVWALTHVGERVASSNVMAAATWPRARPNRQYIMYEDEELYRAAPVCSGVLNAAKPVLKNEAAEVDSFLDTLRSAFFSATQAPSGEDDPDVLLSYPLSGSKHLSLSRNCLRLIHPRGIETVLRVHPAGSRVPSYNLEQEIWRNVRVGGRDWPAKMLVLFYAAASLAFVAHAGLAFRHVGYLIDLVLCANVSYFVLYAARALAHEMGPRYLAVAGICILAAIALDLALYRSPAER
jgi:hypothetical protein